MGMGESGRLGRDTTPQNRPIQTKARVGWHSRIWRAARFTFSATISGRNRRSIAMPPASTWASWQERGVLRTKHKARLALAFCAQGRSELKDKIKKIKEAHHAKLGSDGWVGRWLPLPHNQNSMLTKGQIDDTARQDGARSVTSLAKARVGPECCRPRNTRPSVSIFNTSTRLSWQASLHPSRDVLPTVILSASNPHSCVRHVYVYRHVYRHVFQ